MKKSYKTILKVTVVLIIGFWILSKIPFNSSIDQEITAKVYQNGSITDKTTIIMEGEKSNYLFTADEFGGTFHITCYEKSGRKNMFARINWSSDENTQALLYFQNGTFPSMDVIRRIIINDEMTEFALMFTDGTVIATSDEVYQIYTKHISYNHNTGVTSIDAVNKIPKI